MSLNSCTFTGNLGADAETKNVNGTALATFRVAVNDPYRKDAPPMWIQSQLWGKRAESGVVNHLTKGVQVAITGALSHARGVAGFAPNFDGIHRIYVCHRSGRLWYWLAIFSEVGLACLFRCIG
ncbi:MAG: single-stranded DNA-binding protein [Alphaproteobacteria bacterium]|jgi:hypothetical protein|nr:single-stranded DNA-binding protein [Alphaproteobacteria bacterium]|tara:strand:+ start:1008 stop:1379 length:372 start_codon:yes stop_codon:yes gene_type:complete